MWVLGMVSGSWRPWGPGSQCTQALWEKNLYVQDYLIIYKHIYIYTPIIYHPIYVYMCISILFLYTLLYVHI
jgi:hypothetical protein